MLALGGALLPWRWFHHYWWPIAIVVSGILIFDAILALLGYKTISQRVWKGKKAGKHVQAIAAAIVLLFWAHLFWGLWQPSAKPVDDCESESELPAS